MILLGCRLSSPDEDRATEGSDSSVFGGLYTIKSSSDFSSGEDNLHLEYLSIMP